VLIAFNVIAFTARLRAECDIGESVIYVCMSVRMREACKNERTAAIIIKIILRKDNVFSFMRLTMTGLDLPQTSNFTQKWSIAPFQNRMSFRPERSKRSFIITIGGR